MYNANMPQKSELPSTAKLVKSTMFAAIAAVALLVTVVMPAEYGIDPTGVGNALGLKKMGEIKVSLAQEAAKDEQAAGGSVSEQPVTKAVVVAVPEPLPAEPAADVRTDEMRVTLAPNEGTEIKVVMAKGKKVEYKWSTNGGRANFDVHGDSKELNIKYYGYSKGSGQKSEGVLVAAFDGNHGWFWRNRTSETITVTIKTSGEYIDIINRT
ncbi:MAG: transmembrane anchor protein [Proteobacteria bacterium]|nr:transmembrane anchor protein [Pseudomonadota bacterium]